MSIALDQLTKRYGRLTVVDRVSLEVTDGELFVLLGTSGSGKSTILRLIAGLAQPDGGKVTLHGRDVTTVEPQQRGTGFVFQNYSIFRHMSVAENIEFGLKIRKAAKRGRVRRREQLLDLVGMAGLGGRRANQLSGGQQQRVALARALAYEPEVLLLDEPFGALDVKTRSQLRRSLKEIQRELGVTTILVTHDQDEAFELADRIGVLDRGRLVEVGAPEELYARPKTLFAATFVGAGTVLVGRVKGDEAHFGPVVLPIPAAVPHEEGSPVQVLIRPEHVTLDADEPTDGSAVIGRGAVVEQNFTGALRKVRLRLPRLPSTRPISPPVPFGEEGMFVDAVVPSETPLDGHDLWVGFRGWHILQQPPPQLLVFASADDSARTLTLAGHLAGRINASTTLLAVADDEQKVEGLRAAVTRGQQEAGLAQAELRVLTGDPAELVAAEQNAAPYTMVILAPKARRRFRDEDGRPQRRRLSRLRRMMNRLGPLVTKVLECSAVPVMVVKKERPSLGRVLICTTVGEMGKNDVSFGGWLARRLRATVTLLHVTGETEELGGLARTFLERAASTLRALDLSVDVRVRQARTAAKGILNESREGDYDLIVVGSHGPHSRTFFGREDVTLELLVAADRPVLVVPTEGF